METDPATVRLARLYEGVRGITKQAVELVGDYRVELRVAESLADGSRVQRVAATDTFVGEVLDETEPPHTA